MGTAKDTPGLPLTIPKVYERHDLDRKLGRASRDLKTILSNAEHVRALLKFIGRTRRFKELGDVALMRNPS